MKKLGSWRLAALTTFFFLCLLGSISVKAQASVSLQVFYDQLQPYGSWMQHGSYGYVWIPRVERGFVPYGTNGYWINTEYGNTWVSDYSWGWAPFHYGRWFYDNFYGWMWVPDTVWSPAWVAWRSGGGYYGWAPLMPGFGFSTSYNYYNRIPNNYWNFVPYRYITYRSVYNHCVTRPHVVNIINNTTIVTNNYTDNRRRTNFTGPSRSEIERTTRERVGVYSISERNQPGATQVERGRASFYRPEVDNSNEARSNSVPSRYMRDDGRGKMEQVEAKRERTSESYKNRTLQSDVQNRSLDNNKLDRRQPNSLEQMERRQQSDMQHEDDAFNRFRRQREEQREAPNRNNSQELNRRNEDVIREQRDVQQQRGNELRDQRSNEDVRSQQRRLEQQNLQREHENSVREQRNSNEDMRMQQQDLQRQRENAVRNQQRNSNEALHQSQPERQNSQREQLNRSDEMRRTQERQPQSLQRMERQGVNRLSRPNQNIERQRSGSQQMQRSAPVQRDHAPARSNGGGGSPRHRN